MSNNVISNNAVSNQVTRPGVVVGVDGSPGSDVALRWAARDAELRNAPLTLVHVVPLGSGRWRESSAVPTWLRARREQGRLLLAEARRTGQWLGVAPDVLRLELPDYVLTDGLEDVDIEGIEDE